LLTLVIGNKSIENLCNLKEAINVEQLAKFMYDTYKQNIKKPNQRKAIFLEIITDQTILGKIKTSNSL